jgi:K+-transporting ATPase ATPase B chain
MTLEVISLTIKRLNPLFRKSPVMFVVFIGATLTTLIFLRDLIYNQPPFMSPLWFTAAISFWLWFTLLFANAAEAIAEGKGKAHASSLKALAQGNHVARRMS